MGSFNSFGSTTKTYGAGKNIWHEIKGAYPVGGTISNLSDFAVGSVIPAGSMCVYDEVAATIKIAKATDIKTTTNTGGPVEPKTVKGLLRDDIYVDEAVKSTTGAATGSVVFAGEIYSSRCAEAIPDEVFAVLPMIVAIKEA